MLITTFLADLLDHNSDMENAMKGLESEEEKSGIRPRGCKFCASLYLLRSTYICPCIQCRFLHHGRTDAILHLMQRRVLMANHTQPTNFLYQGASAVVVVGEIASVSITELTIVVHPNQSFDDSVEEFLSISFGLCVS